MITHELSRFSDWQQRAFAASLLSRMWPSYKLFHQHTQFGNADLLFNQLDIIWQQLANSATKFNLEVQLEKLESNTPSESDYDLFVVYPALDFCSGLNCLLQSTVDKDSNCAIEVAQLSENSVQAYLDMRYINEFGERATFEQLSQDPLMQWERDMQLAIVDCLKKNPENKNTCSLLKSLVTDEKLSNLGNPY
ncbi:DUF416 family protein [Aliikangiella marina]|uniref:DUF416 family protein n=1 Tax=Aliikangiella marina TaxID=1712262 RepID=A0A545TIF5_9GAMM|nr:YjaG family protein [Aliikangiella marina]TQV76956.1 DUF416 family protein [Aliikangiella marina]